MPVWPDIATAIVALRSFLNDNVTDRPVKAKQVRGQVDGSNTIFITWDDRLVAGTFVASVDDVDLAPAGFTVLDLFMGRFQLTTAPARGSTVRAHYYFQYFLDSDLNEAIIEATGITLNTEDPSGIPIGLKLAVLNYAAYYAFTKQAIRWAQRMSSKFLLQEEPLDSETMNRANLFKDLAADFFKNARVVRDDYYMREGRRQAPAFNVFKPRLRNIGPRR